MIPFNTPPFTGDEMEYIRESVFSHKIGGDGKFTKLCTKWLEERFSAPKILLTTSCSSALDMAAILSGFKPGDEVILPSFTFSSTATSMILGGAGLVFCDIRPDTMNIDENKIEAAITEHTRAIVAVHYAGTSCEMDTIMSIARKYNLLVIEDAAQGVMSSYKGKSLGTIGDFGCYSFHETKNYSMGEGGAILVNNDAYMERAEVLREKGTNRSKFFRGEVDKYTWVDFGDSYLPSDINAAYLYAQLDHADEIYNDRMTTYNAYLEALKPIADRGDIELQHIPDHCVHNAHMFYLKLRDLDERTRFIKYMKDNEICAVFHYVPLHSAPAGRKYGRFSGIDEYTTRESDRLVRLPMYFGISPDDRDKVIQTALDFFKK
ncbi:MAG: dTDP-4-amino-4,6-dideoxygalactose transaminase [Ruminococcus flavefaciens]|jgi:dTDP-4-amino-4,6-dideoxygalactose transaminase|nr:dTDP-4-amino-4,6-dideoxygalactose transaminase [Ruminococcus flavefaciens]